MKKIEVVLKEEHLDSVKNALSMAGFIGMTATIVKGRGSEGGITLEWRAGSYQVDFLSRVNLMLVVKDSDYQKAINTIVNTCKSDNHGDGLIFVSPVEAVIRIKTDDHDDAALI